MQQQTSKLIFVCIGLLLINLLTAESFTVSGKKSVGVAPPTDGNLYIFSIGIDQYQNPGLGGIKFAKNDAVSLADEFERRARDGYGRVYKTVLLDTQAKKADILRVFDKLSREISARDTFIFNFAGLGISNLSIKTDEFYLFPNDFNLANYAQTGISNSQLQAIFRKIRAANKLVIIDSCKSAAGYESAINSFVEPDRRLAELNKENVLFIGTDTWSVEREETRHGSLTEIILNGIKGNADFDNDGLVSARELEAFVYKDAISYSVLAKDALNKLAGQEDFHPRTVTRGENFEIGLSDQGLEKTAKLKQNESASQNITRSQVVGFDGDSDGKAPEWKGRSYAVLFANDVFDNAGWSRLKNPQNDVRDVAKELKERFGFEEVVIKPNLTTQEIYDVIEAYQDLAARKLDKEEDQLFIFFAGHGITDKNDEGFYVGKDSPYPLKRENANQFVSLDGILKSIDRIELSHIMVVFDACFAGQIWKPSIKLEKDVARLDKTSDSSALSDFSVLPMPRRGGASGNLLSLEIVDSTSQPQTDLTKLAYAKRKMKNRSRRVVTSGDKPVLDGWIKKDGTRSVNSPFADAFLRALQNGGGDFGVLSAGEIVPFIDKLPVEPQIGRLSGSDGDFVFVKREKPAAEKTVTR